MQHETRDAPIADGMSRILRYWRRFCRQGLPYRHLTRRLYEHLTRHCVSVVRRSRRGFYETYIGDPPRLRAPEARRAPSRPPARLIDPSTG